MGRSYAGRMGLLGRLFRRPAPVSGPVPVDDGSALVVAVCFDPAAADSATVEQARAAGCAEGSAVLLRHQLRLRSAPDADAVALAAAADGWASVIEDPAEDRADRPPSAIHGDLPVRLRLSRMVPLTARDLARERARVAGLAQRAGGDVEGYDLLVPDTGRG